MLGNLPEAAINIFTNALNHSLSMEYFPRNFKHAKTKLLPESNKPSTDHINYRPISLLEVPGKIYEKNNQQQTQNIPGNKLYPSRHTTQFQIIKRHRNNHSYHYTENRITIKQATMLLVLRDVAKAIDKVWHNGLKYKIIRIAMPDIITKLLCSYLDSRTASIAINNYARRTFHIRSGVAQRSSLSPTLYSIYTSDIPTLSVGCTNIIYADDITQLIAQISK